MACATAATLHDQNVTFPAGPVPLVKYKKHDSSFFPLFTCVKCAISSFMYVLNPVIHVHETFQKATQLLMLKHEYVMERK